MTCFWDGLRLKLNITHVDNRTFIRHLQQNNSYQHLKHVKWNNTLLSVKARQENYHHIKNFDIGTITRGYDCSSCDPFLILICALFRKTIYHTYNGHLITYSINSKDPIIYCNSNTSHFE